MEKRNHDYSPFVAVKTPLGTLKSKVFTKFFLQYCQHLCSKSLTIPMILSVIIFLQNWPLKLVLEIKILQNHKVYSSFIMCSIANRNLELLPLTYRWNILGVDSHEHCRVSPFCSFYFFWVFCTIYNGYLAWNLFKLCN